MNKQLLQSINNGSVEVYEYSFSGNSYRLSQRCFYIYNGVNVHMIGSYIERRENEYIKRYQPIINIEIIKPEQVITDILQFNVEFMIKKDTKTGIIPHQVIDDLYEKYLSIHRPIEIDERSISYDTETDD